MIRVRLNDTARSELKALRRMEVARRSRDRLQIVLLSDALIALAYLAIPVQLDSFVLRRRGVPFPYGNR